MGRGGRAGTPARLFGLRPRLTLRRRRALDVPAGSILVPQDRTGQRIWWLRGAKARTLCWEDSALLRVTRDRIRLDTVRPPNELLPDLLNPALALLLAARGRQILHAGAVGRRGACVVLIGPPGAGKSSLILSSARRGLDIVSDEILPFLERGGGFFCPGSNPIIRIDPLLLAGSTSGRGVPPARDKTQVDLRALGLDVAGRRSRLAALVFVGRRSAEGPEPFKFTAMSAADALVGLIDNTYNRRVMIEQERRRHLRTCARLTRSVPAYRLTVREGIEHIDEASRGLDGLLAESILRIGV